MASDAILRTYVDTASAKEDVVLNAIEILTATESQITNLVGESVAINTVHSFLTDTLATAGSLAVAEGGDYTATAAQVPSRLTNIVEIIAKNFKVTRTSNQVARYHGQDELNRQTQKGLLDWGNAYEFDFVRASLTSGISGTAPKMNGVINAISKSTNTTAHNSGTVWDSTILDALMKDNYDNSNGDVATDVFLGSFLRKATDAFTLKTNTVVSGDATRIVKTVSSYQTAFGTLNLHTHRYVQQSSDATGRVLAINPRKLFAAWLEKPFIDTGLARSGDYNNRAVVGKVTCEVRNQDSNWFTTGLDKD